MHPRLIVIIFEHGFPDSLQMLLIHIMLNRKRSNVQFLKVQAFQNHTFATFKINKQPIETPTTNEKPLFCPQKIIKYPQIRRFLPKIMVYRETNLFFEKQQFIKQLQFIL